MIISIKIQPRINSLNDLLSLILPNRMKDARAELMMKARPVENEESENKRFVKCEENNKPIS